MIITSSLPFKVGDTVNLIHNPLDKREVAAEKAIIEKIRNDHTVNLIVKRGPNQQRYANIPLYNESLPKHVLSFEPITKTNNERSKADKVVNEVVKKETEPKKSKNLKNKIKKKLTGTK